MRWNANATGVRGLSVKRWTSAGVGLQDILVIYVGAASSGQDTVLSGMRELYLNATEYVTLQAFQNSGGNLSLAAVSGGVPQPHYTNMAVRLIEQY
jgi:hypothetical protein